MIVFTTVAMILVLQLPQQAPANTRQTTASIEGYVLRAGTNEPIARARIMVDKTADPDEALVPQSPLARPIVMTDSQGRFVIKDLEPGHYVVFAQRNGFARQSYGERAPGHPGTPLNIAPGQAVRDVVFRLIPASAIGGRVLDAMGEPLAGITVQVLRATYDANGRRTFQTVGWNRTNDRGEYRVYWITPGRYYVNVTPSRIPIEGLFTLPNSNEVVGAGYVVTYYPGTTDASSAVAVEVQVGTDLSSIDFTLSEQPLFRIRGRVFDALTGQVPRSANVMIIPRGPVNWVTGISTNPSNYNRANGTFEFRDIAPGSYWVRAVASDVSAGNISRITAPMAVDVSHTDVENVVLAFTPGFSIAGRINLEGALVSSINFERMRIQLSPIDESPSPSLPQPIKPDGTFIFRNVQPGDYRLQLSPMPRNTFIRAAWLGRADVTAAVSITGPVSDALEIVLSTQAGQIDGTIVDKDDRPIRGIEAVLIPDRRERRDLFKIGTSDQNGRFIMSTVPPGEYKLFAWQDLEPGAYNDPDFLRKYEALSTPIRVADSSRLSVTVKAIPVGQ